MKLREKDVKSLENVYCCGYCELQSMLTIFRESKIGYTSGTYGWNYDVFHFNLNGKSFYITTGYRHTPGIRLIKCAEYDNRAKNIIRYTPYEEMYKDGITLLSEFMSIQEGGKD